MKFLAKLRSFSRAVIFRSRMEREMDAELRFHLDARVDDLVAAGVSRVDAEDRARLEFGDVLRWKEQGREARGLRLINEFTADLRYGARAFRRSPGFALAAIVSLALGIGAMTAMFSLVDLILLKPLPVQDPGRLVQLAHSGERGRSQSANYPWFEEVSRRTDLFSGVFILRQDLFKVEVDGRLEPVVGQFVTADYYRVLGVNAILGRTIAPDDQTATGSNPVAVISWGYWQRRFGGDPRVLGRPIVVNRDLYTIVGVTPPGFFGLQVGRTSDITMPLIAARYLEPGSWLAMPVVARLNAGTDRERAEAEVSSLFGRFLTTYGVSGRFRRNSLQRAELLPAANGLPDLREQFFEPLRLLMITVCLLLLIACVNVTGLLVARNAARRRELGIRLALGAGQWRIVRQLLTESTLLSVLGAVPGLLLAWWGSNLLVSFLPDYGWPRTLSVEMDLRVIVFALAATTLTVFLFGTMPAHQAARVPVTPSLNENNHRVMASRTGLGRGLVIAQFALSLVLVAGALLLTRSVINLGRLDAGFARDGVLIIAMDAPGSSYEGDKLRQLQRELVDRLTALPGVLNATLASGTPLNGNESGRRISVHDVTPRGEDDLVAQINTVGPGYFDTFRIPLLRGRAIDARDEAGAPRVAVVSESFARYYFGEADAVGRRLDIGGGESAEQFEIVGVARDVRYRDLRMVPPRLVYVAQFQAREPADHFDFALRTAGDPSNLIASARVEIQRVRPDAPVLTVKTLTQQVNDSLFSDRLLATFSGVFAIVALTLAAVGVYGLLAFVVTRRVPEIGVRLALGALPSTMLWMMLREGLALGAIGVAIGTAIAVVALRGVRTVLFGLTPTDPATFVLAALLLFGVALLAAFVPARRAASVDPLVALRAE